MTLAWKVYSLTDAYTPRPPLQYVVENLFTLSSLNILYGPPGCLKSLLLTDLAACVAGGKPWLPPTPGKPSVARATTKAPVLWLDFDNGSRTMHERVEATARAQSLPADAPLFYVSMPSPYLDLLNPPMVSGLVQLAIPLQAQLIVIDNLCVVSGKADENSSSMGTVMASLRCLAEDTRAAVVVIHHQRKVSGVKGRKGDTLRGHSSIEAAIDLALLITRDELSSQLKIEATKTRGPDVWPFGAEFVYEHRPGTKELAKAQFFGYEVQDLKSDRAIRRAVLNVVGSSPRIKKTDLISAVKGDLPDVGVNRIRTQIDRLAYDGELSVTPGTGRAMHYDMTSPLAAAWGTI